MVSTLVSICSGSQRLGQTVKVNYMKPQPVDSEICLILVLIVPATHFVHDLSRKLFSNHILLAD